MGSISLENFWMNNAMFQILDLNLVNPLVYLSFNNYLSFYDYKEDFSFFNNY